MVYLGGNLILLIFFLAAVLAPSLSDAQSSSADVLTGTKDPNAVVIVERALAAMGGHAVAAQFITAELKGSITPSGSSEQKTFLWRDQVIGHSYNSRKETQIGQKTNVFVNSSDGNTG